MNIYQRFVYVIKKIKNNNILRTNMFYFYFLITFYYSLLTVIKHVDVLCLNDWCFCLVWFWHIKVSLQESKRWYDFFFMMKFLLLGGTTNKVPQKIGFNFCVMTEHCSPSQWWSWWCLLSRRAWFARYVTVIVTGLSTLSCTRLHVSRACFLRLLCGHVIQYNYL